MNQKLRELIVYIAKKSEEDSHFGNVKLNKILFYSDMLAYGYLGESITRCTYRKRPYGPAPAGIKPQTEEMVDARDIHIEPIQTLNGIQKRTVADREPRLVSAGISEPQLKLVDMAFDYFKDMNGPNTSDASHDFRWWAQEMGHEIKMQSVFISPRPLSESEVAYGLSLASEPILA